MSDWVMFLQSQTAKDAYKTFKQELEDERAYIRRKNLFEKVKEFKESQPKEEVKKEDENYKELLKLKEEENMGLPKPSPEELEEYEKNKESNIKQNKQALEHVLEPYYEKIDKMENLKPDKDGKKIVIEKLKEFIDSIDKVDKHTNIIERRFFKKFLLTIANTEFKDKNEEKKAIGEFGKNGLFDNYYIFNYFKRKGQIDYILELARQFGALKHFMKIKTLKKLKEIKEHNNTHRELSNTHRETKVNGVIFTMPKSFTPLIKSP